MTESSSPPAAGAELFQVVLATGGALVLTAVLLFLGLGHRSGRIGLLDFADRVSRRVGANLPGWAGLPALLALVTLLPALFGLAWDETLHINDGRDAGPLANPSHYLLLGGLFGIFTAGWLACVMPNPGERPSPAAVRITGDWYAPIGGVLVLASSSFALLGFPLDDVSHRLFGQDVTLWGSTHLMMMSGGVASVLGIVVLLTEGRLARQSEVQAATEDVSDPIPFRLPAAAERVFTLLGSGRFQMTIAGGGMLAALSIFQGEFDYGVPQFRLLYHPVLIAFAAGVALTMVRLVAGRGSALGAVAFFALIRGVSSLIIGPGFGEAAAHFPLYAAEALAVELIALFAFAGDPRDRPYRFGLAAGLAVGTVGVAGEYAWSQVWMPLPWPVQMLDEAILLGTVAGLAGGVVGAFIGCGMLLRARFLGRPAIAAAAASLAALAALIVYLGFTSPPPGGASVTLADLPGSGPREAVATVRFDPPSGTAGPDWLYALAWQGGELLRDELTQTGPGTYRSAPIPVDGTWKSAIRFQRGGQMGSIPVFAPADPAIPVAEIPAPASFERAFVDDREFLQRERRTDVPGWATTAFSLLVLAFVLALLAGAAYCLVRVARAQPGTAPAPGAPATEHAPVAAPPSRPAVAAR